MKKIKLCYIGGGSKAWARTFMTDLALSEDITGEIALYDIDKPSAIRNKKIGDYINKDANTKSKWDYVVYDTLEESLKNADFVVLSILPGTFEEMRIDVHTPEKYGIYQSVGDTAGPGGVLRAMRTIPLYEGFARAIKAVCPNAWVINYTNPMSICTKALYDVFPEIKCFGCCHEVFHAKDFLCLVYNKVTGNPLPTRDDIYVDASGVNHFTWITEAKYKDTDLLSLIPAFEKDYYEDGYYEKPGEDRFAFKKDCFAYGNKVKMDFYNRYGALAAAGDRHLVEFVNNNWYLGNKKMVEDWKYQLTSVDFRVNQMNERIAESNALADGSKKVNVVHSDEVGVDIIEALLGFKTLVSNCNIPNIGQMPDMPKGSIVETNCVFTHDGVHPINSKPLPMAVKNLVYRACVNIDNLYEGIKKRDLDMIFEAFINQALCSNLTIFDAKKLFKEMMLGTREYLDPFFKDIDEYNK